MPDQRDPDKASVHVYVPKALKAAAKVRAEQRGETLTDAVAAFLKRYAR